jgi:hypothetical protein
MSDDLVILTKQQRELLDLISTMQGHVNNMAVQNFTVELEQYQDAINQFEALIQVEPYKSIYEANTSTGDLFTAIKRIKGDLDTFANTFNNDPDVKAIVAAIGEVPVE